MIYYKENLNLKDKFINRIIERLLFNTESFLWPLLIVDILIIIIVSRFVDYENFIDSQMYLYIAVNLLFFVLSFFSLDAMRRLGNRLYYGKYYKNVFPKKNKWFLLEVINDQNSSPSFLNMSDNTELLYAMLSLYSTILMHSDKGGYLLDCYRNHVYISDKEPNNQVNIRMKNLDDLTSISFMKKMEEEINEIERLRSENCYESLDKEDLDKIYNSFENQINLILVKLYEEYMKNLDSMLQEFYEKLEVTEEDFTMLGLNKEIYLEVTAQNYFLGKETEI